MKDLRELAGFILSVAIIWHVYAAFFFKKTSISGLFKESPEIGYVWSNNGDTNPRFFLGKNKKQSGKLVLITRNTMSFLLTGKEDGFPMPDIDLPEMV
ncbi:hypothetical protein ACFFJX_06295 [Pseudarcicella hirudinis]|uniref:hypothetical protein n=1 Tax=Pseudarcicella hirudinis TaxID=1079859 RepID=UPI0035ED8A07